MIWKSDYINLYLSIRKTLNSKNLEKISTSKIEHIEKMNNKYYFDHYKKQIFKKWFFENSENTMYFSKRAKKLINKLNINLSSRDMDKVNNIEPREFTQRRSMKTIEVPYYNLTEDKTLNPNAYFFYKNVRTYKKNSPLFKVKFFGELYITSKEIVLYDREKNLIQQIIKYKEITSINLKNYCLELKIKNGDDLFFRYKDNELIYISLNRLINIKKTIEFQNLIKDNENSIEKTFETILTIK